jgi:hypothetical protein
MKVELSPDEVQAAVMEYVQTRVSGLGLFNTVRAVHYGVVPSMVVSYEPEQEGDDDAAQ